MDGTLKLVSKTLAYADLPDTSNPIQRFVDWTTQRCYLVKNAKSNPFVIDPGATMAIFSGLRTTSIDNTTEFLVTQSTLSPVRYRFTWDLTGTAPALRTDRGLNLDAVALTLTAGPNSTLTMVAATGTPFSAVQAGDVVFIPGLTTGDPAGPFSALNEGFWSVLAVTGPNTTLQLVRPAGTAFSGISESVTPSSTTAVQAFSAAGVQAGDQVNISASFVPALQTTFSIVTVTASWFEVTATQPLPVNVTGVPGTTGIAFYYNAKRFVRVEVDQLCALRLNGDTTNLNTIAPWVPADSEHTGGFEKAGPTWSATVVNLSSQPLNLIFISAE